MSKVNLESLIDYELVSNSQLIENADSFSEALGVDDERVKKLTLSLLRVVKSNMISQLIKAFNNKQDGDEIRFKSLGLTDIVFKVSKENNSNLKELLFMSFLIAGIIEKFKNTIDRALEEFNNGDHGSDDDTRLGAILMAIKNYGPKDETDKSISFGSEEDMPSNVNKARKEVEQFVIEQEKKGSMVTKEDISSGIKNILSKNGITDYTLSFLSEGIMLKIDKRSLFPDSDFTDVEYKEESSSKNSKEEDMDILLDQLQEAISSNNQDLKKELLAKINVLNSKLNNDNGTA